MLSAIRALRLAGLCGGLGASLVLAAPSFDCTGVRPGSSAARVCADPALAALDRRLAEVYAAALAKAGNEHPPQLRAEQRGWIKGRDQCWQAGDQRACIADQYTRRIAELQARYRLLPIAEALTYVCDGVPAKEVQANFFDTRPPTLLAEFGDSVSLMYAEPEQPGLYRGRNEQLRHEADGARISWGYGAAPMDCRRLR